jgi:hypothetical protein
MTNIYTKNETNNLLNAKDSILTFTSPLVRTTNNITFNEASITTLTNFYNKTNSDGRYLQLTGGTINGNLRGSQLIAGDATWQFFVNGPTAAGAPASIQTIQQGTGLIKI